MSCICFCRKMHELSVIVGASLNDRSLVTIFPPLHQYDVSNWLTGLLRSQVISVPHSLSRFVCTFVVLRFQKMVYTCGNTATGSAIYSFSVCRTCGLNAHFLAPLNTYQNENGWKLASGHTKTIVIFRYIIPFLHLIVNWPKIPLTPVWPCIYLYCTVLCISVRVVYYIGTHFVLYAYEKLFRLARLFVCP